MERKRMMALIVCILFALVIVFVGAIKPSNTPLPIVRQASAKEIVVTPDPKIKKMLVTAYCPCEKCCGKYADGKTSIGRDAKKTLGVAADPKVLSYGTKLDIPGIGVLIIDDTGGAMRQSTKKGICHIDIRFHDHKEALRFGRQWLDVKILN